MFITNKKIISALLVFLSLSISSCEKEKETIYSAKFTVCCKEIFQYKRKHGQDESLLDFDKYQYSLFPTGRYYDHYQEFPFPEKFLDSIDRCVFPYDIVTMTFTKSGKILSLKYTKQGSRFFIKAYAVEKTEEDENTSEFETGDIKTTGGMGYDPKTGEVHTQSYWDNYNYYSFINKHGFKCSLNIDDPLADYQITKDMNLAYGIIKNTQGDFIKVDDLEIGDSIYLEYYQGTFDCYVYGFNPITNFSYDLLKIKDYDFTEDEIEYLTHEIADF